MGRHRLGGNVSTVPKTNIFVLIFLAGLVGCKNSANNENESFAQSPQDISPILQVKTLELGDWGAASETNFSEKYLSSIFTVNESGATLDLGCGFGSINSQIVLDENGKFEVDGTFQFQGGAQPIDGFPEIKARFKGQLISKKLLVSYTLDGASEEQSAEFTYGVTGNLLRCM